MGHVAGVRASRCDWPYSSKDDSTVVTKSKVPLYVSTLRHSLRKMANRIDKGFNSEVRIEPPKETEKSAEEDDASKQAIKTILDATIHMQDMNLEGQPILSLPEALNGDEKPEEMAEPPRKKMKERK